MKNIFASALLLAAASAQQVAFEKPVVKATEATDPFNFDLIADDETQQYVLKNFTLPAADDTMADVAVDESLAFRLNDPYTAFNKDVVDSNATSWDVGTETVDWIDGHSGVVGTGALCHLKDSDYRCTGTDFRAVLDDQDLGVAGFGRPNKDNGLNTSYAFSMLKHLNSENNQASREFALGALDLGTYNVAVGQVNDDMWKASADDEERVAATARDSSLLWALEFTGWWVDGERQEFENSA